ncbi:MAG TPA: MBL fold metallo-hydrolase [Steroidobacteraceae bacterium]|nr:MBL fold metallo-hydrolase [Steroidobacteraceae bacterium]
MHAKTPHDMDGPRRWALCGVILLVTAWLPAWAQSAPDVEILTSQLRDNLYLLQGSGGNTLVSTGADGVLLVDDEYADLSSKLMTAIGKLTGRPVRFVINTHWHNDHTGGNAAFGKAGALIIAQDNSSRRMSADQVMSLYGPQAAYAPVGRPKLSFSRSMQLHLDGDTIDLIHLGPAHTDGDAVVFFRGRNLLMTGDLFVGHDYRPPFFDDRNGGSLEGMIAAAQAIVDLIDDKTTVIPGHGGPATRAEVADYHARLIDIRERIRAAIARGEGEEAVVAAHPIGDFAIPGRGTDRWVRVVYREYQKGQ